MFNTCMYIHLVHSFSHLGFGFSCTWDSERGFGERSWRYSAVINDCKVEKIFVEGGAVVQNSGPDPFEVSDADTMMKYLASKK